MLTGGRACKFVFFFTGSCCGMLVPITTRGSELCSTDNDGMLGNKLLFCLTLKQDVAYKAAV